ncbi:MAG TPA: hypothetical protein VGD71_42295 [Kribbella sp.]
MRARSGHDAETELRGLADRTAALIPSAAAVILEEAGHMAHIDQPTAWLAAVAAFLD